MYWIKKYDLSNFGNFLRGSHYDPITMYLTYMAEKKINYDKFLEIYTKFTDNKSETGFYKYFDLPSHLARAFFYSRQLKLDKLKNLDILDLGTGPGYFPFAAGLLGHNVQSIDIGNNKMYKNMRDLLCVSCANCEIKPMIDLNFFKKKKFILITAFQLLFDQDGNHIVWKEKEWKYFIKMLQKKYLKKNGRIFFQMNTIYKNQEEQYNKNIKTLVDCGAEKLRRSGEIIFR